MNKFDRNFDVQALARWCQNHPDNGIAALLSRWVLPGNHAGALGLRIAVRNNYLNFYVKGQSVAELRMLSGVPRLKVHSKYVAGISNKEDATVIRATYERIPGDLPSEANAEAVDLWVRTAATYAGQEKRFVDDLVAENPGTIDLEMALPGDDRLARKGGTSRNVAPRMDLVTLQREPGDALELAFWEAKCADNGELRASEKTLAPVVGQLNRYVDWLKLGTNGDGSQRAEEVVVAYQKAARTLEALAVMTDKPECQARELWRHASAQKRLRAVVNPGIVVANYCAQNDAGRNTLLAARAKSFVDNGHANKLTGFTIECYATRPTTPLPALSGEALPA